MYTNGSADSLLASIASLTRRIDPSKQISGSDEQFAQLLPPENEISYQRELLQTVSKMSADERETAEIERQINYTQSSLYHEQIQNESTQGRAALFEVLDLLKEAGLPINEVFAFRLTQSGQYELSGYGIVPDSVPKEGLYFDPRVALPNQEIIEGIFNGTLPEYADLSKEVRAKLDDMWGHYNKAHDLFQKDAQLMGRELSPYTSAYEQALNGMNHIYASRYDGHHEAGKTSAYQNPEAFTKWKKTIAPSILEVLSQEQIYARFFRDTASPELLEAVAKKDRLEDEKAWEESYASAKERIALLQEDLKFYQAKLHEIESSAADKA